MASKTSTTKTKDTRVSVEREALRVLAETVGVLVEQQWPGAPALTRDRLMYLREAVKAVEDDLAD